MDHNVFTLQIKAFSASESIDKGSKIRAEKIPGFEPKFEKALLVQVIRDFYKKSMRQAAGPFMNQAPSGG